MDMQKKNSLIKGKNSGATAFVKGDIRLVTDVLEEFMELSS